jgi:hypothetical protein
LPSVDLIAAKSFPAAATLAQLMAPLASWADETSTPFSIVLAAAAVACRIVADMRTVECGAATPVPVSGPESSLVSCGECPSEALAAGSGDAVAATVAAVPDARSSVACGELPDDDSPNPARATAAIAADVTIPTRTLLAW